MSGHKTKDSFQHVWQLLQTKFALLKDDFQKRKEERLEKQKALQAAKAEEEAKRKESAAEEKAKPVKMTRKDRLIAEADRDISTAKTDALTRLLFPAYAIDRLAKNQDDFMMFIGVVIVIQSIGLRLHTSYLQSLQVTLIFHNLDLRE